MIAIRVAIWLLPTCERAARCDPADRQPFSAVASQTAGTARSGGQDPGDQTGADATARAEVTIVLPKFADQVYNTASNDYIDPRSERSGRSHPVSPVGLGGHTCNEDFVLRTGRLRSSATLVALTLLAALGAAHPAPAEADTTDGTLTVIVDRDVDANGSYDTGHRHPAGGDPDHGDRCRRGDGRRCHRQQRPIRAQSHRQADRRSVLRGRRDPRVTGDLTPVAESDSFAPLSTAVDVTSEDQTVRMGVALADEPEPASLPKPEPTAVPSTSERTTAPRFAVGDLVFRDVNRSGVHDADEPAGSQDQRAVARRRRGRRRLHGHFRYGPLQLRQPPGRHLLGAVRRDSRGLPARPHRAAATTPRPIPIPTTPAPRPRSPSE